MEIKILTDGKLEAFGKAIADALKAYTDGKVSNADSKTMTFTASTTTETTDGLSLNQKKTVLSSGYIKLDGFKVGDAIVFKNSTEEIGRGIFASTANATAYGVATINGVNGFFKLDSNTNGIDCTFVKSVSASYVEAAKEKWIDVFMPFDTFIDGNGDVIDEANFSIESSLVNYTFDHIKNARGFRIYDAEYDGDHDLSNLCAIQAFRAYLSDDMAEDYFYGSYRGKSFVFEFDGFEITTHAKYDAPKTWEFTGDLLTSKPVAPSGFFANAKVGDRVEIWYDSNRKNDKYSGTVVGERAGSIKYICVIASSTTYLFCVYSNNSVGDFMKGHTLANKQETLTQSAYDALTTKDANTTYFITE